MTNRRRAFHARFQNLSSRIFAASNVDAPAPSNCGETFAEAREFFEENLAAKRAIGDKAGIAIVINNLGLVDQAVDAALRIARARITS